jgi:hypothetical protein
MSDEHFGKKRRRIDGSSGRPDAWMIAVVRQTREAIMIGVTDTTIAGSQVIGMETIVASGIEVVVGAAVGQEVAVTVDDTDGLAVPKKKTEKLFQKIKIQN